MQKPKSVVDKNINTEIFNHEKNLDYVSNIQTLGDSVQQDTSMDSQVIAYHCRFCGESVNYPSRCSVDLELYYISTNEYILYIFRYTFAYWRPMYNVIICISIQCKYKPQD